MQTSNTTYRVQSIYKSNNDVEKVWLDTNDLNEAKEKYDSLSSGMEIEVQLTSFENIDEPNPVEKLIYSK